MWGSGAWYSTVTEGTSVPVERGKITTRDDTESEGFQYRTVDSHTGHRAG